MTNPYATPNTSGEIKSSSAGKVVFFGKHFPLSSLVLCTIPLLHYFFVWGHWITASMILGEPARPGINDPKGFLMGIPSWIGMGLMLFSFAVAPVVLIQGIRRKNVAQHVATYIVSLVGSIILFRLDIMHITSWIAD